MFEQAEKINGKRQLQNYNIPILEMIKRYHKINSYVNRDKLDGLIEASLNRQILRYCGKLSIKNSGSGGFNAFLLKKLKVMKKSVYSNDSDGEPFCGEVFLTNNAKERSNSDTKEFEKNR